jgi:hypothetical protein
VTGVDEKPTAPMADVSGTIEQLRQLEQNLFQRLGGRGRWRFCRPNPELVRLWGRIKDDLERLRTLIERQPPEAAAERQLRDLLANAPLGADQEWSAPAAREFAYSITEILPLFGDATYLTALLEDADIADRFKKASGKTPSNRRAKPAKNLRPRCWACGSS